MLCINYKLLAKGVTYRAVGVKDRSISPAHSNVCNAPTPSLHERRGIEDRGKHTYLLYSVREGLQYYLLSTSTYLLV